MDNRASFGHAIGVICGSNYHGWVTDDKADGYCVFMRAHSNQGNADSNWACPAGTTIEVNFNAPGTITNVSIEKVFAG